MVEDSVLTKSEISEILDRAYQIRMADPHLSSKLALKAYHATVSINATNLELRSINSISTAALYNNDFPDPDYWLDLLERRSTELNQPAYQGVSLILRARWSYRSGKIEQSVNLLHQALEYFDPEKNVKNIARVYNSLGKIYFDSKQYDKANECLKKARPFVRFLPLAFHLQLEQNIGAVLLVKKQYAEAWSVFHDLLPQVPETELVIKTNILQNLGQICQLTSEYPNALDYFFQALKLKQQAGMKQELIRTMCNIVYIYLDYEKPDLAYETLLKAQEKLPSSNLFEHIQLYKAYVKYYDLMGDTINWEKYKQKLSDVELQLSGNDDLAKSACQQD